MGIDKKYALLDTDFLYKSHLARNAKNHTLTDFVIEFAEYEFFCHEMIKKELSRHELNPDPNPWLEEKVKAGKVKLYTDREIVSELGKLYGEEATSIYLELLETSCDTFNANFYKQYYGSLNESYARWKEAQEHITSGGSTFETDKGYQQQTPWVGIANTNQKLMLQAASEFGLTPSSRSRIIAGNSKAKEPEDEMEALLGGDS